jgi:DNA ligase 1
MPTAEQTFTKTLYKRDTKQKIREWTIEVDGGRYRTISGLMDGEKVTNEWTIAEPKNVGRANATTPTEQAMAEAEAEITKKKEKNYVEDLNLVDTGTFVSPMLAESFDDYGADLVYPVFSQPKYDGIRCTIGPDGLLTRNGKPIVSCPHILKVVQEVFAKNKRMDPKMYRFDGELYNHELKEDFNKICSIVKQKKPTADDFIKSEKFMRFYCYDVQIEGLPFRDRSNELQALLKDIPYVVVVPTKECKSKAELDKMYESYMGDGYEGQIIRVPDSEYQTKRTKFLLKRKEFMDGEWMIDECFEGQGNRTGTLGKVTLLDMKGRPVWAENGERAKAQPKGGMDFYRQLWADRGQLHGKQITIRYFRLGKTGAPLFPYFSAIRDYE